MLVITFKTIKYDLTVEIGTHLTLYCNSVIQYKNKLSNSNWINN